MRISDWSSDVCSSDLRHRLALSDLRIATRRAGAAKRRRGGELRRAVGALRSRQLPARRPRARPARRGRLGLGLLMALRPDLALIADAVPETSRVLAGGCGRRERMVGVARARCWER